jgi:hypothetical protein
MAISLYRRLGAGLVVLATTTGSGAASAQSSSFERAAYVTCREAHAMAPAARLAVALVLLDHSARQHNVVIPEDERGAQIGYLVRSGCTLAPDAYLFAVIDRAVEAEMAKLSRR